jgi:hypothetical protein
MFNINNIIRKFINKEPLTEKEKFNIINSNRVKKEVLKYLSIRFSNLTIDVLGNFKGNIFDLMDKGLLEGWCWQTTETSIIFLNDDDYIERGNLKLGEYQYYYHSWICFKYKNIEYVFDPCLDILCKKSLYIKLFEPDIKGRVTSKKVKENFVNNFNLIEKDEIHITGNDNVNSSMYRNNTKYKVEIEKGKVKKLEAHYY